MVSIRSQLSPTDAAYDHDVWFSRLAELYSPEESERIRKAYLFAEKAQTLLPPLINTITYLQQSIQMVNVLVDLGLDATSLIATLLLFPVRQKGLTLAQVEHQFGPDIVALIESVGTMVAIDSLHAGSQKNTDPAQMDKLRKMLLAMVEDPRGVLIKLVEQLCLLRLAKYFSPAEQQKIATQTRDIYAPLANRLGIGQIKWEMEDLAFRYIDPKQYQYIASLLDEKRIDREDYLHTVIAEVKTALAQDGIEADVQGRVKHIYSIWRKMCRKNVDYHDIYDVRAVRILVEKLRDTYAALGTVHRLWRHVPKEFDDYIATPKSNGYQSLHTAVVGPNGKVVEVQIRTYQMHHDSELGVASHWRYKEGIRHDPRYEDKIAWLRQLITWQEQVAEAEDVISELREKVYEDRVYVLTPKGEVVDLPKGATPLDFAYFVHTSIGHRCRGAKVNGRIVPLSYHLKTSDKIEILTGNQQNPSRDWLNPDHRYLATPRARAKVRNWFRALTRSPQDNKEPLPIKHATSIPSVSSETIPHAAKGLIVQGVDNLLTHFAGCCHPIPGDKIIGYITVGQGVSIHRQNCVNMIQAQQRRPERLVVVSWGTEKQEKYSLTLHVLAEDRPRLLHDITQVFVAGHNSILALNSIVKEDKAYIIVTVEIPAGMILEKITEQVQQVPSVIEVKRHQ